MKQPGLDPSWRTNLAIMLLFLKIMDAINAINDHHLLRETTWLSVRN